MVDKREIVRQLSSRGFAITPEGLELLASVENGPELVEKIADRKKDFLVTAQEVSALLEEIAADRKIEQVEIAVEPSKGYFPAAAEMAADLQLSIANSDVTGKSRCTGGVQDFVAFFRNRFERLSPKLRGMAAASGNGTVSLADARGAMRGKQSRVIGMVYSRKVTKNGHLLFEVEDEENMAPCLVPKDSPLMERAQSILPDEVMAFDVFCSDELLIIKDFVRPGRMFQEKRKKTVAKECSIAFLSDLHVGSKLFKQKQFENFLKFLNGEGPEELREKADKIKYVSIAGDLCDGIGVYPTQEKELVTKDIYVQYEIFCEFLAKIPEWIEVIVAPGNHDAVRTAEPQPSLPEEFVKGLKGRENVHFVGNPSVHRIEGLEMLLYHGTSLDGLISNSPALKSGYEHPERVGIELLNMRHLAPLYGEDPLVPEARDYMVIDEQPDIFHFGHVHKNGYADDYNGTMVVNSGTWQAQTDFQVRIGHIPTPCLLPLYDLHEGKMELLDFNKIEI